MKEDYQKALKKLLTLFFLSNSVSFNGQNYQKQKGPGTSEKSLFKLQNKFRKISFLVMYYLTKLDHVICNMIMPLLFALLNLESVERKGKN